VRDDICMREEEVREFLRQNSNAILVSNGRRGFPHAVAMCYELDEDGSLRFHTYGRSQKVRNIERDPRVTLLVESGSAYDELRGVMLEGTAEISKDLDATVATMLATLAELAEGSGETPPDVAGMPEAVKQQMAGKRVLVRVRPRRVVSWDHGKLPKGKAFAGLPG